MFHYFIPFDDVALNNAFGLDFIQHNQKTVILLAIFTCVISNLGLVLTGGYYHDLDRYHDFVVKIL